MANKLSRRLLQVKHQGLRSVIFDIAREFAGRHNPFRQTPLTFVYASDVIAVDWTQKKSFNAHISVPDHAGKYDVAWVISPPGRTSGGHQNAFRFMEYLLQAGHRLTVYLYSPSPLPKVSIDEVKQMMAESTAYPDLDAEFRLYDPIEGIVGDFNALFASDWGTAYPVYSFQGQAKRFYFTQDFEPYFFSMGSDYVLAENTYKFGFYGVSAGKWLAEKLMNDFSMPGDFYTYGVDSEKYFYSNNQKRNEVLFYARPPTPRRATEFGLLALKELHNQRPDIVINLVGWDMSGYDVPFPYVNHTALDISQLNDVYNRCAAGLILSLTNMSLLPLEVMAAGVVPVVNRAENTTGVLENQDIQWVEMSPQAIARRMIEIIDNPNGIEHSIRIAQNVEKTEWKNPQSQFISIFEHVMNNSVE